MNAKIIFPLSLLLMLVRPAAAQSEHDMIYQANTEPIACTITDETENELKYIKAENPEGAKYVVRKEDLLLAFKTDGEFLLPGSGEWVKGADPEVHKIISRNQEIFPAKYVEVNGEEVTYQDASNSKSYTIPKKDLLLIINKDGSHQLLAAADEVAKGLEAVASKISTYAQNQPEDAQEAGNYVELSEEQITFFKEKAEQKGNDFGMYLRIISNKEENEEDKKLSIEKAITLFLSDTSKVEVSSLNRKEKTQFMIGEYLERLRLIPYDKVDLVWFKAQMVSRFRKGEDGRYYGVLTAQQLFRAYMDNEIAYQDVTEKNIEVVLARYDVFDDGVKRQKWDVFLSDISVQQTREK